MAAAVVRLSGVLDIYASARLRETLSAVDGPVVLDLTAVRFLDASAMAEIARLGTRIGAASVALVVPDRKVRHLLEIVQFDRLFRIVDRPDGALG